MRSFAELMFLKVFVSLMQMFPIETCARFCRTMAWLTADVLGFRRKVITENLRGVYPEITDERCREMARQMWYHLFLMCCEVAQAPRKIHHTNWRKYIKIRDERLMTQYLIDYRPLVAVSGHYGNFEIGGYITGLLGMPSYTVARPLDNHHLDEFINRFRAGNNQFVFPKDGSATAVQRVVDSGGILALLGDQYAGTKGCWVDFLGRPASCHKAIALFTLSGNAPMMVSYCRQTERPLHFEIGCTGIADPLNLEESLRNVTALTQWYCDRLGEAIRLAPEQYWWVHRRWKEKPSRSKRDRNPTTSATRAA